jgi:hypothetical protein
MELNAGGPAWGEGEKFFCRARAGFGQNAACREKKQAKNAHKIIGKFFGQDLKRAQYQVVIRIPGLSCGRKVTTARLLKKIRV